MITAGRLASRWLACGSPIVNRSAEPARLLGCAALACVADVVGVAAREQDDIAAAHALDVRVAVDPQRELAFVDDVQGADIGEADRKRPRRSVRNDPLSAQTDTPQQLREQIVRLTGDVEAESGGLERRRIGKIFRRFSHGFAPIPPATLDEQYSTRRGTEP